MMLAVFNEEGWSDVIQGDLCRSSSPLLQFDFLRWIIATGNVCPGVPLQAITTLPPVYQQRDHHREQDRCCALSRRAVRGLGLAVIP